MTKDQFLSLKPGDKVIRIGPDGVFSDFTNGKVYIVTESCGKDSRVLFNNGERSHKFEWFKLVDKPGLGLPDWF